jgi:hypothetical protein
MTLQLHLLQVRAARLAVADREGLNLPQHSTASQLRL